VKHRKDILDAVQTAGLWMAGTGLAVLFIKWAAGLR
jgi:hypothetical protein